MATRTQALEATRSYLDVLTAWTTRLISARYQQSLLGVLWAVAQPAAQVAIFTIIFTRFVPVQTDGVPYQVFSFVAMVPWTFFAASLTDMVTSLTYNLALVTKIYFPREILPLSAMLARLLDFVIAFGLLGVLLAYYQVPLFPAGWLYVPLILVVQLMLMIGVGLVAAALNVFFRDVKHLVDLSLRLLLYASPVIYPVTKVPENLQAFYFLNPMAGVITAYRDVLLYQRFPGVYLLQAAVISALLMAGGYWFFKRVEFTFADVI